MQIIELIKNIFLSIANYFQYKNTSFKDNTIAYIDKQIENIKNEIINELNRDYPNVHYINRMYKQLSNFQQRKTKL